MVEIWAIWSQADESGANSCPCNSLYRLMNDRTSHTWLTWLILTTMSYLHKHESSMSQPHHHELSSPAWVLNETFPLRVIFTNMSHPWVILTMSYLHHESSMSHPYYELSSSSRFIHESSSPSWVIFTTTSHPWFILTMSYLHQHEFSMSHPYHPELSSPT